MHHIVMNRKARPSLPGQVAPGMHRTTIDLPVELLEKIDQDAAQNMRKRSDHIRFLLSKTVHLFNPQTPAT